jgi:phosphatidylserine/phosphatidylglycerophosphate/cardiolipin synthase-like enzyme
MTATTRADAQQWFLPWSSARYSLSTKDGRPWGNGTHIAKRESATPPGDPWDEGCTVTPLIGGYETLCLIADTLEGALTQADADPDGHVYIADWRLNPLRDMSRANPWKTGPWKATDAATLDQTVIGLILRLMAAGVKVRVLVWLPVSITRSFDLAPHIDEHWYLAQTVAAQAAHLGAQDRGIVAMDSRVADFITASHHQKMCVIRVGDIETAFVGGVDWAFTRRDAPADPTAAGVYQYDPDTLGDLTAPPPQFNAGDWQSGVPVTGKPGTGMPVALNVGGAPTHRWPDQAGVDYFAAGPGSPAGRAVTDLPVQVYGQTQQIWHDQHFRLAGPIVQTIEAQFCERWIDAGSTWDLGVFSSSHLTRDQVIFSKKDAAYDGNGIFPLPEPDPVDDDGGTSFVQMWRTIPLRSGRTEGTLSRGEFTIMAGISNAIKQSTQLIWLFDQYFFSRPLARQLNYQIKQNPNLHVVVVLPPFPDDHLLDLIHLRKLALNDLVADLDKPGGGYKRVAVYNTWHPDLHQGIYVHAKAKMFDDKLIAIGSGNLNRRSFTCDTELDCAVLDAGVLDLHQQRLWKCLFPAVP